MKAMVRAKRSLSAGAGSIGFSFDFRPKSRIAGADEYRYGIFLQAIAGYRLNEVRMHQTKPLFLIIH
jgi:hypothetical protein